jgi:hypothetical protein
MQKHKDRQIANIMFIYLYIKMERQVSAAFGHPQTQFKNLFTQKLHIKVKRCRPSLDSVSYYIFVLLYNIKYDR